MLVFMPVSSSFRSSIGATVPYLSSFDSILLVLYTSCYFFDVIMKKQ